MQYTPRRFAPSPTIVPLVTEWHVYPYQSPCPVEGHGRRWVDNDHPGAAGFLPSRQPESPVNHRRHRRQPPIGRSLPWL